MRVSNLKSRSKSGRTVSAQPARIPVDDDQVESDEVFELAAETFRYMASPTRLRIIRALCDGEKNVSDLIADVRTTQPNMSQHLNTLYRGGILGRRTVGVQIFYFIRNAHVVTLCRAVCTPIGTVADTAS